MKERRIMLEDYEDEWIKRNGIRFNRYVRKCISRSMTDPDSPEAQIVKECSEKPTKGEEKVECVFCGGEGMRKLFKYSTSGLICKECYRERDFEQTVKKMEVDSIKNSSAWRDR